MPTVEQDPASEFSLSVPVPIDVLVNAEHPVLARAGRRLVAPQGSREITSYDRMHHRHNRS